MGRGGSRERQATRAESTVKVDPPGEGGPGITRRDRAAGGDLLTDFFFREESVIEENAERGMLGVPQ